MYPLSIRPRMGAGSREFLVLHCSFPSLGRNRRVPTRETPFLFFFLSFLERYDVLRGSRLVKLHEPASPFMPLAKLLILPPCILFEALVGPVARPAIVKIRGLYRDKRPTAPTVIHLFANSYNRCKFKFLFLPSFLPFFPVPGNLGDNGALEGGRSNGSAKEIILQRGGGGGGDCIYEFIFHDARRGQARRPKMGVSRTIRHPASSSTLPLPRSTHVSFLVPQIILPGVVPFSFSPGERAGGASSSHLESNRGPLSKKLISLSIILGASGSRRALTDSPQTTSAPQTRETGSPLSLPHPRPLEP